MEQIKAKYKAIVTKYQNLQKFFDILFLVLLAFNIFGHVIQTTTFDVYFGSTIANGARGMMFWVALIRVCFLLQDWKELIGACALGACLYVIYCFKPDSFLYFLGIMALGTFRLELSKVLKTYVIVVGLTVLVAVTASLTGTISNLVYLKDSIDIRDSFGICYPTDFASYLFYLFVFFWIAWKKIPGWVSILISIPFLVIVHWYALSDTCSICGVAFLLVLFLLPVIDRYLVRDGKLPKVKKLMDALLVAAFPLFALFMFALIGLYAWETKSGRAMLGVRINALFTSRLRLALRVFEDKGVHAFGSALTQLGNGNTTFPVVGYDFVDSSYPLILLRDGWIIFILICGLWAWMTYRAVRAKEYRLAFGMGLITLHSFIEHHFTESHYNILLFLQFAILATQTSDGFSAEEKKEDSFGKRAGICFAVILFILVLCTPFLLAVMQTICGAMRLQGNVAEIPFVILTVLLILTCIKLLDFGAALLWNGIVKKERNGKAITLLGIGCAILIGMFVSGIALVSYAKNVSKSIISQDELVLTSLDQVADGKIYSTEFPLLYAKNLKNMKFGILTGEDLARKKNVTVIVPRGVKYYVFLRKDFSYAAISDTTSIYSNDEKVIEKLQELGKDPKPYFDEVRYVELPTNMAKATDLRRGSYTIIYRMKVTKGEEEPENVVHLSIMGNRGYTIIADEMIPAAEVDENGNLEYVKHIELEKDTSGIMFYILASDGCQIEVKEVSYQMTP